MGYVIFCWIQIRRQLLLPKTVGKYSGDIIIPEKVKVMMGRVCCYFIGALVLRGTNHHPNYYYWVRCSKVAVA